MGRTVGYMLTWRTYGTWLAEVGPGQSRRQHITGEAVRLDERARRLVHVAIAREAKLWGETLAALAVSNEHVHMVVRYGTRPIDEFVGACKAAGRIALQGEGYAGRVWANGYDTRFCFDDDALRARVEYVQGHGDGGR